MVDCLMDVLFVSSIFFPLEDVQPPLNCFQNIWVAKSWRQEVVNLMCSVSLINKQHPKKVVTFACLKCIVQYTRAVQRILPLANYLALYQPQWHIACSVYSDIRCAGCGSLNYKGGCRFSTYELIGDSESYLSGLIGSIQWLLGKFVSLFWHFLVVGGDTCYWLEMMFLCLECLHYDSC